MKILRFTSIAVLAHLAFAAVAVSDDNKVDCDKNTNKDKLECRSVLGANLDLSVPESPALFALGLATKTVDRPATSREFATALQNGLDPNGNFQSGIALDFNPYLMFFGEDISIREYRGSKFSQVLSNTQVSIATVKGGSDEDESARLALGFRITPWNLGDPRLDTELDSCFNKNLKFSGPPPAIDPNKPLPKPSALIRKNNIAAAKRCREKSEKRNAARSSWTVGFSPVWTSEDGNLNDLESEGGSVWTSLAIGFEGTRFEENSQLILHGRYQVDEQVPDDDVDGQFFEQDSLQLGGQLRLLVSSYERPFSLTAEATYIMTDRDSRDDDDYLRYSIGVDFKVTKDLWLELSLGSESGRDDDDESFILSGLKWGFSSDPDKAFGVQK